MPICKIIRFATLPALFMLVTACGPTDENNANVTNNTSPNQTTCEADEDCGSGMFCDYYGSEVCEDDPFGGDTREANALFLPTRWNDGETYDFDDLVNFDDDGNPLPGTCLDSYSSGGGGRFSVPKDFILNAKVGDKLLVGEGLEYYGQKSSENAEFDNQGVAGELEITAVGDGTLSGRFEIQVVDLVSYDASECDREPENDCFTYEGTFDAALVCTPAE